ncbi:hypothetical protein Tco_0394376, partial [Tanacetum coccineum]
MSAMANTIPIVTTVTKTATKEKALKETKAAPIVNIQDFYEEHYEDILPVIMDKIHREKQKEVHTRLDFGDNTKRSERTHGDGNVFGWLGHRRQSAFNRLSDTCLPSTTNSGPDSTSSRDHSQSRGRPYKWDSPRSRGHFRKGEQASPRYLVYRRAAPATEDAGNQRQRGRSLDEEDLAVPWTCEEVDPFTPRIRNFKSSRKTRMPNNVKTYDGIGDPEDYVKKFQAAAQHILATKELCERSRWKSIKSNQRDGETLEDFMERFKVETGRIKGAHKCMRIFGFMHGVNNPELTKCLNEHVPKTMEEMMTVTTAFIQGETAAASKKKGHAPWKPQDQSKRHVFELKSDFREITFPPLTTSKGTEGPLVIEAEISGHMIHRMLLVTIRDVDHSTKAYMNFMIMRSLSPYNGIIRRPRIREIRAVPSTAHGMLKFLVNGGIVTIRSTILIPAECATVTTSSKEILKEAEKKRGQAPERSKAIQAEVQKLVEAGIMREVHYHDWLSNPVMVKKHDGSWRMCVDFRLKQGILPPVTDGQNLMERKWPFIPSNGGYCYTKHALRPQGFTGAITAALSWMRRDVVKSSVRIRIFHLDAVSIFIGWGRMGVGWPDERVVLRCALDDFNRLLLVGLVVVVVWYCELCVRWWRCVEDSVDGGWVVMVCGVVDGVRVCEGLQASGQRSTGCGRHSAVETASGQWALVSGCGRLSHTFLPSQPQTYHTVIMVKMVPYEAFACHCGVGDVVLRESYKHETRGKLYYACPRSKPRENTFGCKFFVWKEERVRLLVSSPGASTAPIYSSGSSSTLIYSPRSSTPLRYSLGSSTPPSYSLGTSRNAECLNCKHLLDKIT